MKTEKKAFYTDFKTAATWGGCNLILCNNLPEIDSSVWDNMRFEVYNEESDSYKDIYQWFITDLTEWQVEWQEETFDLQYTYSDLLDCYILCVLHFGTPWSGVECKVYSDNWIECNTDKAYKL